MAESNIVGTAIGAAMIGKRPIAEIQFADFILPAVNQIISEELKCAIVQIMTGNVLSQSEHPLVVGYMVVYIILKVSRASLRLHRVNYCHTFIPYDAKGLLLSSIESNDPVLFFEHKKHIAS